MKLSGLIVGFIIGALTTIGALQLMTGPLPRLNLRPAASESAPATPGAPAGTNAPAAGADTGTPQKTQ